VKVSSAALAGFSNLFASRKHDEKNSMRFRGAVMGLFKLSVRMAFFGSAIVIWCTEYFVALWVGSQYFSGILFTALLGALCFRDSVIKPMSVVIIAGGDMRLFGLLSLAEAIVKILLTIFFISYWKMGVEGVLIAQLSATLLFSTIYFPYKVCNVSGVSGREMGLGFIFTSIRALPSVLVFFAGMRLFPASWVGLIFTVGVAGLVNVMCHELPRLLKSETPQLSLGQRLIWSFRSQYI
jgi:O-antigen/teichoic acid export membrane protein